jgi:DNA polymerase III subunit epsilon
MNYVAIDFETANAKRSSACALGLVVVRDGIIIEKLSWLIRPPELYFNPFNTYIHGITEKDVIDKPEFDQLWVDLKDYLEGQTIVAHNASFDLSVLRNILDIYNIPYPTLRYFCTVTIAQNVWPDLPNHRLNSVAQHLGLKFKHHDALEDAFVAAEIVKNACQELKVPSLEELSKRLQIAQGSLFPGGYRAGSGYSPRSLKHSPKKIKSPSKLIAVTKEGSQDTSCYDKTFVFTGILKAMERSEAIQKVVNAGGSYSGMVTEKTNYLVRGFLDVRRLKDGEKSTKLKTAELFIAKGAKITILNEDDFLGLLQ